MTEMQRILSLSRGPAPEVPVFAGAPALRPAQVACLVEWVRALTTSTEFGPPGLAALLGCGHGKTLVSLLLAPVAERVLGRSLKILHLVPASLVGQLKRDRAHWRWWYLLQDDEILSHEALSSPTGRDALRTIRPELIIIDEAHAFADPDSGRWRRVAEYLRGYPECRVVVLSGTLTWKSLRQARHLLLAALRGWSPLPCDRSIEHWASVLDVKSEPCADDLRALRPLVQWGLGRTVLPDLGGPGGDRLRARTAYRTRLSTCPGVVLTDAAGVDVSLCLTAWTPQNPTPPAVVDAVRNLETLWTLPDGTELVSALEFHRAAATLPLGCYLRWDPTTVDPVWVERRRAWSREVRSLVAYAGHVYQTPGAVEEYARSGRLDARRMAIYRAWAEVADQEPPTTEVVWLDGGLEYLTALVAEYADLTASLGALVWTKSPAIGRALAKALRVPYHGQGDPPPSGGLVVASYVVHGTGWSGAPAAGYRHALFLEPPSSAATWEQVLSRLHRAGQTDDVSVHVLCSTSHGYAAIAAGVDGARYVRDTTGAAQRLLLADMVGYSRPV